MSCDILVVGYWSVPSFSRDLGHQSWFLSLSPFQSRGKVRWNVLWDFLGSFTPLWCSPPILHKLSKFSCYSVVHWLHTSKAALGIGQGNQLIESTLSFSWIMVNPKSRVAILTEVAFTKWPHVMSWSPSPQFGSHVNRSKYHSHYICLLFASN